MPNPSRTLPQGPRVAIAVFLLASVGAQGCIPRGPTVLGPAPDAPGIARELAERTRLGGSTRIVFTWRASDQGARASGRGVARVAAPELARLDLFLENLEPVAGAVVVGDELRLPAGAALDVVPPVELLWSVLGVFRPGASLRLVAGDRLEDGVVRLRYAATEDREVHYHLGPDRSVTRVEVLKGGRWVQEVALTMDATGPFPSVARFRDMERYRELTLVRESVTEVEPFPSDIWNP